MGKVTWSALLSTILAQCLDTLGGDIPTRVHLAPGAQVAWDGCEQAYARLVSVTPHALAKGNPCGVLEWELTVAVGVLRCVSVVNDEGQPPSVEQLTGDATVLLDDAEHLSAAIRALELPSIVATRPRVGRWTPLGPQGGFAGGEWVLVLIVAAC